MTKINPFKPNSPVPSAMFAGRLDEIVALESVPLDGKTTILTVTDKGFGKRSERYLKMDEVFFAK